METADRVDVEAAAGVRPTDDIILTAGIVLDIGRIAADGRTVRGGWLTDGGIRRTDGLDEIPPYVSTNANSSLKLTIPSYVLKQKNPCWQTKLTKRRFGVPFTTSGQKMEQVPCSHNLTAQKGHRQTVTNFVSKLPM